MSHGTFRFAFTETEFVAAARVPFIRNALRRRGSLLAFVALTAAALYGVWLVGGRSFWLFPIYVPLFAGFLWFILDGRARRQFRRDPFQRSEMEVVFSDRGVKVTTPATTADLEWSYFTHFSEDPRFFMLFHDKVPMLIVPRRAFPTLDVERDFAEAAGRGAGSR